MRILNLLAGVAALAVAGSANAASMINLDGSVTLEALDPGLSFTVDYVGKAGGAVATALSALTEFTFTGVSGNSYNFSYSIDNDSTVSSRLRSFGFNVDTNPTTVSSTGTYAYGSTGDNFPEALGNRDACFRATSNGNCTGGPGGLTSNPTTSGSGTFSLNFSAAQLSIKLSDFAVRYQSISPDVNKADSGVGIGTVQGPAVPEPANWAMMIAGFGLTGAAMRYRRRVATIA